MRLPFVPRHARFRLFRSWFHPVVFLAALSFAPRLQAQAYVTEFNAADIGGMGPTAIAIDMTLSPEILYVADEQNGRILKYDARTLTRLAVFGSVGFGDGQFNRPYGLAIEPTTHDLYVAERGNHRVQRVTNTGAFVLKWGQYDSATNSPQGNFNEPIGVAVDAGGYVYVVDKKNNRIQKFAVARSGSSWQVQNVTMWGSLGSAPGQLARPYGIVFDRNGGLWVAEADNHRIQRFSTAGDPLKIVGTFGSGGGQFNTPIGIGMDAASYLYVTETNSDPQNPSASDINQQRVQRFRSDGSYDLYQWGNSYGTGQGQFRLPFAIALGPMGRAYVTDYYNQRVQIFDLAVAPPSPQPHITSPPYAYGTVGQAFSYQIVADKPVDGYGATGLPPGLTLNTATGAITGTPSASGSFQGTISVWNSSGGSTTSFNVTVQPAPSSPGNWQTQDVGAVAAVGSASESGGSVTLRGSGADIWERADEFRFRYQAWNGDGEIVARVTGLDNTSGWAKAGVMFRESLATGARHAFMCLSPGNGTAFQRRTATDGLSTSDGGPWVTAPYWVRLTRSGSTFVGYVSSDGVTWTQVGSVAITLPSSTYVGLAVTSHNDGTLCTATFDQVALRAASNSAPLSAPSGLSATAVSSSQINLAWTDTTTTETGFEIEVSTNNSTFSFAGSVGGNVTSYAATGLATGVTYYYRVRAIGSGASSPYSNTAAATTPAPSTLGAPTNLSATPVSSTQVRLNWTDNATSETAYDWALSTDNVNFAWQGALQAANTTTITIGGLAASTTYYFRVRAVQGSARSPDSNTASATTPGTAPPPTAPAAPTGLTATAVSETQVNLAWTDNSNNESGFEVQLSEDNVSFSAFSTSANATSYAVTRLRAATRYYFRVRALNGGGVSDYTNTVSATTPGTPPASATLTRVDVGAVAAAGTYSVSNGVHTLSGSGEDIWDARDEFSFAYLPWSGDGSFTAHLTGVQNTDYWAKAGIMFREGTGADARNVAFLLTAHNEAAMQARTAPGGTTSYTVAPENWGSRWLRITRTGSTFVAAQSGNGVDWTTIGTVTLNTTGSLLAGLVVTSHHDGTLCTVTFDNVTTSGLGTGPTSPAAPTNLAAHAVSATQVNLTWTDNATNEAGFRLERSTDNINFAALATPGANATSYTDATTSAQTQYFYRIQAVNGALVSSYSNVAWDTTPPPSSTIWQHTDVGFVGDPGSDDATGATIWVKGSGADIWDRADGFRYVYQTRHGDCQIEARVASMANDQPWTTNAWAKAGVMIRETLADSARNVFVCLTYANGAGLQVRAATGGTTTWTPGPWGAQIPYWVRLVRTGDTFTASVSSDGVTWSTFGTVTLALAADVQVGFAVTSHDNGKMNTAWFEDPFIR